MNNLENHWQPCRAQGSINLTALLCSEWEGDLLDRLQFGRTYFPGSLAVL
jgi:hypothetical protein